MNTVKEKIVLITGASSGMGKAFTKALLKEGATVYAVARRVDAMQELKTLGAHTLKMDITNQDDIDQVVKTIEKETHGVDILVNCAGFGMYGAMEDTTLADARYQFEVNLFGMAYLTQKVLPSMRKKMQGRIINISSMGGKIYTPLGGWYHASKHAVEGWSDCLRLELKSFNIDVVVIEPGAIATEFADVMIQPMLERSGQSAYSHMATAVANATHTSVEKGALSDVQVVVDMLMKAVHASSPKTRYVGGKYAKLMIFVRKWFGDRVFDRMVMSVIK
ncbi:oxidoreductase [Acinetobacter nosocomialis]|uniref:oxidoreductase n=1 Tax=Acinetobacter nosocomialis TaxID=106654 RepID=UPI001ADAB780|nr:oxidoreductase [Acinetobacter nosocomialis]MBO8207768.1 SDR family NAD(P)-dependent oxidoreductase [Acinetobacter nosocomialis]MBO8224219.1 SDR family NAD(P)-dependent oxidoreductase [Acinetobacter nosocomialis]MBO8250472.1 SDR family NAD(P)-dependent oxidoreductase [Acinetobacter nosocomialis]